MKLSAKNTNDLLNLIDHTRLDISYGVGGSYGDGDDYLDSKGIKSSERAIILIKKIILGIQI